MGKRLNKEREEKLQPKRIKMAIDSLTQMGKTIISTDATTIWFMHDSNTITYYPYSGWFTGKGIKDGRGWSNLEKQIS